MNRFWILSGMVAALLVGCQPGTSSIPSATNFGTFEGNVVAVWDADGRNMTLREDFGYVDSQGRRWLAPAGATVNGASIPPAFWTVIGGPFEGRYRNASVVHDVGCEQMNQSWEEVHRMFYEACRCGGVEETEAKMLYYAVYHFGPRWKAITEQKIELQPNADGQMIEQPVVVESVVRVDPPPPTPEEIEQVASYVVEENPQPHEMRDFSRSELHSRRRRNEGYTPGFRPSGNRPAEGPAPDASAPSFSANENPAGEPQVPNVPQISNEAQFPNEQLPSNVVPPEARPEPRQYAREGNGGGDGRWNRPADANPENGLAENSSNAPNRGSRYHFADQLPPSVPLTAEEQQWAANLVAQYIEGQAGEPRPATYQFERGRSGVRVLVTFLHADEAGNMVPTDGGDCLVRISRQGEVMECVTGR